MPVSEAQKRATKKYAQTRKGREALQRAYAKRVKTEEYRAYQRQKQAEYRRRKKEQTAPGGDDQTQPSPIAASDSELSELDQLIESFESTLQKYMAQKELSYQLLPPRYQRIVDALNDWKAEP